MAPSPHDTPTLDAALAMVASHLRQHSRLGHKDRLDLQALAKHCGTVYVQTVTVPQELYASLLRLNDVKPLVLFPLGGTCGTAAGTDAVVLFFDPHGALKGLPENKRAAMLSKACGLSPQLHGDCFVGRIRSAGGVLAIGSEAPPQMLVERDWLEAAQAANAQSSGTSVLEAELLKQLEATRRAQIAASVAAAGVDAPGPAAAAASDAGGAGKLSWSDGGGRGSRAEEAVTIEIEVPAATKVGHVRCTIKEQWLSVSVLTLVPEKQAILEGTLFQQVMPPDCDWYLEGSGHERKLVIVLEKKVRMRWLELTRPTA